MKRRQGSTLKRKLKAALAPRNPDPRQKAPQSKAQLLPKAGRRDLPGDRGARERQTRSQGNEFLE